MIRQLLNWVYKHYLWISAANLTAGLGVQILLGIIDIDVLIMPITVLLLTVTTIQVTSVGYQHWEEKREADNRQMEELL